MEQKSSTKRITVGIIGYASHSRVPLSEAINDYLQKGVNIVEKESTIELLLQKANDSIKDIETLNEELNADRNPSVRKRTYRKKR